MFLAASNVFPWVPCTVHGTCKYEIQLKKNFKIGSHGIIHIFKNYFTTVFSIISGIQTDSKRNTQGRGIWSSLAKGNLALKFAHV